MLRGSCLCGRVGYEIRGEPRLMYYCHCGACRKATGSSFATNLLVLADDFVLVSGRERLSAFESSPDKHRYFCSCLRLPDLQPGEGHPRDRVGTRRHARGRPGPAAVGARPRRLEIALVRNPGRAARGARGFRLRAGRPRRSGGWPLKLSRRPPTRSACRSGGSRRRCTSWRATARWGRQSRSRAWARTRAACRPRPSRPGTATASCSSRPSGSTARRARTAPSCCSTTATDESRRAHGEPRRGGLPDASRGSGQGADHHARPRVESGRRDPGHERLALPRLREAGPGWRAAAPGRRLDQRHHRERRVGAHHRRGAAAPPRPGDNVRLGHVELTFTDARALREFAIQKTR